MTTNFLKSTLITSMPVNKTYLSGLALVQAGVVETKNVGDSKKLST